MKNVYIIVLFALFIFSASNAQTRRYYCEVKGIEKTFSGGLIIIFDFGERESYNVWGTLSNKLKFVDEKGKEIEFHSMVDASNYMVD